MNSKSAKVSPERWKTVDFTRPVSDIAQELGLTPITVYQKRSKLFPRKEFIIKRSKAEIASMAKEIRKLQIQLMIYEHNPNKPKPHTKPSPISKYLGKIPEKTV